MSKCGGPIRVARNLGLPFLFLATSASSLAQVKVTVVREVYEQNHQLNQKKVGAAFRVKNHGSVPITWTQVRLSAIDARGKVVASKNLRMPDFQSSAGLTRNMLLPSYQSRMVTLTLSMPLKIAHRTTRVEILDARPFNYRSNLSDPQSLLAFIFMSKTKDVEAALRANPGLKNVRTSQGLTPTLMAVLQDDIEMVKRLEKLSGPVSHVTRLGQNALHFAAMGRPEMVRYVASKGVRPQLTSESRRSCLEYAVERGNVATLEPLVRAGANIDSRNSEGFSALLISVLQFQPALFKELRRLGASPKTFDREGRGPVALAVSLGSLAMGPHVLSMGGQVNEQDPVTGRTPLHIAVISHRREAAQWLIQRRAKFDVRDRLGRRPEDYIADFQYQIEATQWRAYFQRARKNRKVAFPSQTEFVKKQVP